MGYACFLRFSELASLKESDLQIISDHMEIFIESKTDQYRDGAWVMIAQTATNTCPVKMAKRYITLAVITGSPDLFLFHGIAHTKNSVKLSGLSYTRMQELPWKN